MTHPGLRSGCAWPEVIDLVVFDFDGVMTDNTVLVFEDGREAVRCNRGDGLGISMLLASGFRAMILSTEVNQVVAARAAKLKLPVQHGCQDKAGALAALLRDHGLDASRVVYLGNDLNDQGCLRMVGLPVVVADAVDAVVADAALVLTRKGGDGAVRELCDLIIDRSCPAGVRPGLEAVSR